MKRIFAAAALFIFFTLTSVSPEEVYPGKTIFIPASISAGINIPFSGLHAGGTVKTGLSERGLFNDNLELGLTAGYNYFISESSSAVAHAEAGIFAGYNFGLPASLSLLPYTGIDISFTVNTDSARRFGFYTGCDLDLNIFKRSKVFLSAEFSLPFTPAPQMGLLLSMGVKKVIPFFIAVKMPEPILTLSSEIFSPDNDGSDDTLTITPAFINPGSVKNWRLELRDKNKKTVLTRKGKDGFPQPFIWNGMLDSGDLVSSADEYTAVLTVEDILGRKKSVYTNILIDVLVITDGDKIKINIPNIIFPPQSVDFSQLSDPGDIEKNRMIIRRLAEIFKRFSEYDIRIEGHANSEYWNDNKLYNIEQKNELIPLSLARAEKIRAALIEAGINSERITAAGLGAEEPVADFDDLENNWKNRRVEFILIK